MYFGRWISKGGLISKVIFKLVPSSKINKLTILNFSTKSKKVDDNSIFFEDWTKMKITSENKPPLKG